MTFFKELLILWKKIDSFLGIKIDFAEGGNYNFDDVIQLFCGKKLYF